MIILFLLDLIWRKLKAKLGIKHCVSLAARKRLVAATLLSVLDTVISYIYIYIYMQAPKHCLQALDSVYLKL